MSDLISRLSEIRSHYNCFNEKERKAYHTLSEAIEALQEQKTGRWTDYYMNIRCSACNAEFDAEIIYTCKDGRLNYCPNCGSYNGGEG